MASETHFTDNVLKGISTYSYAPRIFAYLAGLTVAYSVFKTNNNGYLENPWIMFVLFFACLTWPHIAYFWAKQSSQIQKVVINSLLFDSFFAGLWIPLMSFEVIPCTIFVAILMMNNISLGGLQLFIKGLYSLIFAMTLSSLFVNPSFQYKSSLTVILVCIPMITLYPMVFAAINYKLTRLLLLQKEKLIHLKRHDSLSGVFSRRYWEERLLKEFERCQASGEKACVMMVDIDHFKNINDTYGHMAGDRVLKQLGGILKGLRDSDIVGRYDGGEFAVLLPDSTLQESLNAAERLRQKIETTQFDGIEKCTVSIGIASLGTRYEDAYKWLNSADKALSQAKKEGRNKVNTWINAELVRDSRTAV